MNCLTPVLPSSTFLKWNMFFFKLTLKHLLTPSEITESHNVEVKGNILQPYNAKIILTYISNGQKFQTKYLPQYCCLHKVKLKNKKIVSLSTVKSF